jgi:hypothetical protein
MTIAMWSAHIKMADEIMAKNANGVVCRAYHMPEDNIAWHYGHLRWWRLEDEKGIGLLDDPLQGKDEVTLDEFHKYLETWYWPKRRELNK